MELELFLIFELNLRSSKQISWMVSVLAKQSHQQKGQEENPC